MVNSQCWWNLLKVWPLRQFHCLTSVIASCPSDSACSREKNQTPGRRKLKENTFDYCSLWLWSFGWVLSGSKCSNVFAHLIIPREKQQPPWIRDGPTGSIILLRGWRGSRWVHNSQFIKSTSWFQNIILLSSHLVPDMLFGYLAILLLNFITCSFGLSPDSKISQTIYTHIIGLLWCLPVGNTALQIIMLKST